MSQTASTRRVSFSRGGVLMSPNAFQSTFSLPETIVTDSAARMHQPLPSVLLPQANQPRLQPPARKILNKDGSIGRRRRI